MDQKYVGKFIQTLRKERGITQKELAERICVSDKTISKWENGNSMPDTTLLMDLCNELDISVNELLNCERIPPEDYSKKAEVTIMNLMKEKQENKRTNKVQYFIGLMFLLITITLIGLSIGKDFAWYIDIPSLILLCFGCMAVLFLSGIKKKKAEIVHILRKSVIPIGSLIAFISLIAMLHQLSEPEKIGSNLAVSLLSIIYSIIAYIIFYILEQHWRDC